MSAPIDLASLLVYEDRALFAFDKPAGVPAQGGSGVSASIDAGLAALTDRKGRRPQLVHRLDRETTGIILAGRTPSAIAHLNRSFAERRTEKTYFAIVCGGAPDRPEGEISLPLAKANLNGVDLMRVAAAGSRGAVEAHTTYRTLAAAQGAALLLLQPLTGRMHQLRAHLAAIGRPIAGDGKYGGLHGFGAVLVPSLMLHAARLRAPHPLGGVFEVAAAPPAAFVSLAAQLGLAEALPKVASGGSRHQD